MFAFVSQRKERGVCLKRSKHGFAWHDMLLAARCVLVNDCSFFSGAGLPSISFLLYYTGMAKRSHCSKCGEIFVAPIKQREQHSDSRMKPPLSGLLRTLTMISHSLPVKIIPTIRKFPGSLSSATKDRWYQCNLSSQCCRKKSLF